MLQIQLSLGGVFETAPTIGSLLLVPILIVLSVLFVRRRFLGFRRFFVSVFVLYLVGFACTRVFAGGAYHAAQSVGIFVPWTIETLEDESATGGLPIDEEQQYTVVRFSPREMTAFIHAIEPNGTWQEATIVPSSLVSNDRKMTTQRHSFPNVQSVGYVFSQKNVVQRQYDYWTKQSTCFLDIKNRTLYVYYDYGQWG